MHQNDLGPESLALLRAGEFYREWLDRMTRIDPSLFRRAGFDLHDQERLQESHLALAMCRQHHENHLSNE